MCNYCVGHENNIKRIKYKKSFNLSVNFSGRKTNLHNAGKNTREKNGCMLDDQEKVSLNS
jgi:hypothetical protein